MKYVFFLIIGMCFLGCKKNNIQVRFLDEYILQDSIIFQKSVVGGLSGIDNYGGNYYLVVDDAREPRVLVGDVIVEDRKILDVTFKKTIFFNDTINKFYQNEVLDLESVFVNSNGNRLQGTEHSNVGCNTLRIVVYSAQWRFHSSSRATCNTRNDKVVIKALAPCASATSTGRRCFKST